MSGINEVHIVHFTKKCSHGELQIWVIYIKDMGYHIVVGPYYFSKQIFIVVASTSPTLSCSSS